MASGVYDGIRSFAMGTQTLGFGAYNPQTGAGDFQSGGVGNFLGMMSMGYLNMAPNGMPEWKGSGSAKAHAERWGKGWGDLAENLVSDMAAVPIGLCYDMPMDFAKGQYYEAGYALGYNGAALVAMIAAPEDAGPADEADAAAGSAAQPDPLGLDENPDAEAPAKAEHPAPEEPQPGFAKSFGQAFKKEVKERYKAPAKTAEAMGRSAKGKFGFKPLREWRAGSFRSYCGEYLGTEIAKGLLNPVTYENLDMTDPRSPWSTAAWQTMLYRQGPYTPKKQ